MRDWRGYPVLLFQTVWLKWLSSLLFFQDYVTQVTILTVALSGLCDSGDYPVCCSFRQCDSSDYYVLFCRVCVTQVTVLSTVLSRPYDLSDYPVCCSFRTVWLKRTFSPRPPGRTGAAKAEPSPMSVLALTVQVFMWWYSTTPSSQVSKHRISAREAHILRKKALSVYRGVTQ